MINAALVPMRTKFVGQMLSRLGQLEALRCAVNDGREPLPSMAEIGQIAHRMSGVAETLGFARIGRLSMEVDMQVAAALSTQGQVSQSWRSVEPLLEDLLDEMEANLDS